MNPNKLTSSVDIEDLALELGGKVTHEDGRVFNAGGRAGATRLPKAAPTPAAAPAPAADNSSLILRQLVELLARPPQIPATPAVHIPAPQVVIQPAAKVSWEFEFKRNPDGSIKSITANPK